MRAVPLYREQYRLLIAADSPLGNRKEVTWEEVGKVPLCLLTPDNQNRRIINELLRRAGASDPAPTLESNSMIVLFSHVRTGRWASVMPALLAETLGIGGVVRAVPIVEPIAVHTIGLIVPDRDPMAPATAALVAEAQRVAPTLDRELALNREAPMNR
jgi:DNA-binding transcriptional LysR family regulator